MKNLDLPTYEVPWLRVPVSKEDFRKTKKAENCDGTEEVMVQESDDEDSDSELQR